MMGQQLLIFNPSGILKHGVEVKGKKKKVNIIQHTDSYQLT